MLPTRIRRTTDAVTEAAEAVTQLAESAQSDLSEVSGQVRAGVGIGLPLIAVVGTVAVIALIVALVAVSRA